MQNYIYFLHISLLYKRHLFVLFSERLMRLVHMAYKARKQCIHSAAVSSGRQYNYGCVQLCNKAGALLKELVTPADNCYQTNTLTKVCRSL